MTKNNQVRTWFTLDAKVREGLLKKAEGMGDDGDPSRIVNQILAEQLGIPIAQPPRGRKK